MRRSNPGRSRRGLGVHRLPDDRTTRRELSVDQGPEGVDFRLGVQPGPRRQSGLDTGFVQELLARPSLLDRDLGEEQAARAERFDDKSIAPDQNVRWEVRPRLHAQRFRRSEDRNLDQESRELPETYRREARVVDGRRNRRLRDRPTERVDREGKADAPAEHPVLFPPERNEYSPQFVPRGWILILFYRPVFVEAGVQMTVNLVSRKADRLPPFVKFDHGLRNEYAGGLAVSAA